jgi:hypothetical protein
VFAEAMRMRKLGAFADRLGSHASGGVSKQLSFLRKMGL